MSIATLKKKSQTLYSNTVSVRGAGFSLNGVRRIVGVVGQTNLAKSVTRTPFRGNDPVGHGGGSRCRVSGWRARATKCAGTDYPVIISNSGSFASPQTLIKRSVMNTKGMLQERYKGILHGTYPNTWVQPTTHTDSGLYTENLASEPFVCAGNRTFNKTGYQTELKCNVCQKNKVFAKNLNLHARHYSQYLLKIKANCDAYHFPFPSNNRSCAVTYATIEQAQQDGH